MPKQPRWHRLGEPRLGLELRAELQSARLAGGLVHLHQGPLSRGSKRRLMARPLGLRGERPDACSR